MIACDKSKGVAAAVVVATRPIAKLSPIARHTARVWLAILIACRVLGDLFVMTGTRSAMRRLSRNDQGEARAEEPRAWNAVAGGRNTAP